MYIAVVGARGVVGRSLVEHFRHLNHKVFEVELHGGWSFEEAVKNADVVFIATLPIYGVDSLIYRARSLMQTGTLLVHGTSIEKPKCGSVAWKTDAPVTLCHCHFLFRPEVPLRQTLFGMNISFSFTGLHKEDWKKWMQDVFLPFQPIIHYLEPGEHDRLTQVSQLIHMIFAIMVGSLWSRFHPEIVRKAVALGGPPCQFLLRSVLRVAQAPQVPVEILLNHPSTDDLLGLMMDALSKIRCSVSYRESKKLQEMLGGSRSILGEDVTKWDDRTAKIVRFEADARLVTFKFHFSQEKNQLGLLVRVVNEFDIRGVDKTTTIAQISPDGGCDIEIGIREDNDQAKEAAEAVRKWL